MYERHCVKCGVKVLVSSSNATKVKCDDCKINKKVYFDTDEKVYCRLCNKARKRLDRHIEADHKITVDQYLQQFPNAPLFAKNTQTRMLKDDETKIMMSESAKNSWQDTQKRQNRIDAMLENPSMKGCHHSDETKQKIADSVRKTKGELHYLTVERRKQRKVDEKLQLQDYIICPLCLKETNNEILSRIQLITSSHLTRHNYTTEQFKKEFPGCYVSHDEIKIMWETNFDIKNYEHLIKNAYAANLIDTNDQVYCRCCLKPFKRISPCHLELHELTVQMYQTLFPNVPLVTDDVITESTIKAAEALLRNRTDFHDGRYGYGGIRKDIGHFVRSMIEANFCRILKLNNIRYKYEPGVFKLNSPIYTAYIPDIELFDNFYIWPNKTYIELKHSKDVVNYEKLNIFTLTYPDKQLHVLIRRSTEWKTLERLYRHLIPLWESGRQNIKITPDLYK